MLEVQGIFETPIVKISNFLSENQSSDILEFCKIIDYKQKTCSTTMSMNNNLLSDNFIDVKKSIEQTFTDFAYETLGVKQTCQFKICSSWATQTLRGGDGIFHSHHNSYWSGVLYFSDETSPLILHRKSNDSVFNLDIEKQTKYSTSIITVSPKKSDLILFPSNLIHKVSKNNSMHTRYSIAFNILPHGSFGYDDSSCRIEVLDL